MKSKSVWINIFLFCAILLYSKHIAGQTIADGIAYQTIVRNASGSILPTQLVSFKMGIYKSSPTGSLIWEETVVKTTDSKGLFTYTIGKGISTGAGIAISFNSINWADDSYFLKVAVDITGASTFEDIGTAQLLSVPYAFYSLKTDKLTNYYLDQLNDANVPGPLTGNVVKWNGTYWIASTDSFSDTVAYSYNSFFAENCDTAFYSYSFTLLDTILFAYNSDTSQYSALSGNSLNSNNSFFSDTAAYALSSTIIAWLSNGNTGAIGNYLGTNDSKDVVIKTNNSEVMRVSSSGNVFMSGTVVPSSLSMSGNDGLLSIGTFGSGIIPTSGSGEKMLWYPNKSSFRCGGVSSSEWDDASIGNYSFASGYNCIAGNYSFASGNASVASGDYAVAIGKKAQATAIGVYPSGVSVAIGDSSIASTSRSVAIGKGNIASTNSVAIAIGYNNLASGAISTSFGTNTIASGHYSFALGYYASTNSRIGSFVFSDASSSTLTTSTINNQFLVRASGGILFYSDSLNTMGVTLSPGSGSWASVSDKNKKENYMNLNPDSILEKIERLKITSWNYKSQNRRIRHIGPMSQDFYSAFHLGESNKTISTIDIDGITIIGIKSLQKKINELSIISETKELNNKLDSMNNFDELNDRLDELEGKLTIQKNN